MTRTGTIVATATKTDETGKVTEMSFRWEGEGDECLITNALFNNQMFMLDMNNVDVFLRFGDIKVKAVDWTPDGLIVKKVQRFR